MVHAVDLVLFFSTICSLLVWFSGFVVAKSGGSDGWRFTVRTDGLLIQLVVARPVGIYNVRIVS